ncbi:MAG: PKD domain-containing protein [Chitinophagales bacterium]
MKQLLFILTFISSFYIAKATHIVGGEITYTHVAGNTYEVTLTVYRDEFNGSANAQFDSPAMVYLYDVNGSYIDSFQFFLDDPNQARDLIENPYPNPCLTVPANIEIQKGVYTKTITVPNGFTAFDLIYARCCRNGALINNLTNPEDQGSTFTVRIPATNIYNNSSPTFDLVPPIFVCLGSDIDMDQSATDIDGDSLYYKVCDPLQGLDDGLPVMTVNTINPPPNFGAPFDPVVWLPGYDANNQLGGIPMTIDGATGLVSGTPDQLGSFVVGLCVEEWRNGVLLSEVLRDFQYTVSECDIPNSAIPTVGSVPITDLPNAGNLPATILGIYVKNCDDLNVDFLNDATLPGGGNAGPTDADYYWDFGDGNTSTQYEPTHLYPDTGTYIVKMAITMGINGQTCSDTGYYVVFVYPVFNPNFNGDNACANDTANFIDLSTTAIYDNVVEWEWNFGDGSAPSTVQNPSHEFANAGTYDVILFARTDKGCTKLDTNQITIFDVPTASIIMPTQVCAEDTADFLSASSVLNGTIDSTFWDFGFGVTSNATDTSNYFPNSGSFPIQIVSMSNLGCIDSLTLNLNINPLPTTSTSGNDTICPNTNLPINATGGVFYAWSPVGFLNNPNIQNPVVENPTIEQYYYVEVTDANTCTSVDSLFIGLKPPPPADAGRDTSVCLNAANMVSFNTTVPLNATGGISYSWSPAAGLSATNIPNPDASPSITTDYIVTVSDAQACQANDTVKVVVLDPSLELIQVITDSICFGDTVIVDVYDQGNVSSYAWSPTNFVTDPTVNEPGFFPPITTEYILTIQNYCYQDEDTVLIEVIALPNLDAGPLDSVCMDNTNYQLSATPTNLEIYEWTSTDASISDPNIFNPTISPSVSSTYFLVGTDSVGTLACVNRDNVTILVNDNPTLDIQFPVDYFGFICQGDSILLNAVSNNATEFAWDADASLTALNTQTTQAFPQDTTEYFVTVTNGHDCTNRDSIIVNVQKPIVGSIVGDSIMCVGGYVDLEGTGGLYYNWYPSEANFTNNNYSITQAHLDTSMRIFLVISNDCFDDTTNKFITVNPLPDVDAGEDITIIRDDLSGFLDGSGDGKPLWYTSELTFTGILNSPAQYGPEVQPQTTTNYVLEIENPVTGCKNYDTMTVVVDVITLLAFPTGFSPNGDGTNDFARIIKYLNIEKLDDFSIYNRYGENVFTTTDLNAAWDGTYKGEEQEMGVYTFLIKAVTKDKESILKKGNITLIR